MGHFFDQHFRSPNLSNNPNFRGNVPRSYNEPSRFVRNGPFDSAFPEPTSPVKFRLPPYEKPPAYVPKDQRRQHGDYNTDLRKFVNRTIILRRAKPTDQLGFNIRGGAEHYCGIFLSRVEPHTEAQRLGLREGDQILVANGKQFTDIQHAEAVRILKANTSIELLIKYFPYGYEKTYEKGRTLHINY